MAADFVTVATPVAAAFVGGFLTWATHAWRYRHEANREAAQILVRHRDPLLRASFELQSRFYNIVARRFLQTYWHSADATHRSYALWSTLWLVGQYLGVVEILRREVQYLDLGSIAATRELNQRLAAVTATMASDAHRYDDAFVMFRSDQRAIGEFMVTTRLTSPGMERPDCLGYSEFVEAVGVNAAGGRREVSTARNMSLAAWIERFSRDLQRAAEDNPEERAVIRLIAVQRALIDLVDLLDPDYLRYPELDFRGKLPMADDAAHRPATEIAHFLWTLDSPWERVDRWATDRGYTVSRAGDETTCRGRTGPLRTPSLFTVRREGKRVTICAEIGRRKAKPIHGSLRSRSARTDANQLLALFDRPRLADGGTWPDRFIGWVLKRGRRLRRGA